MNLPESALDLDVDVLAENTTYNIVLQVALRAFTFLVNAILLHRTTLAVLGIANVRLALLYSTICFFAREAFRRSCLRPPKQFLMPGVCNVVWLCPLASVIVGLLSGFVWTYLLVRPDDIAEIKHYTASVWLYVFAVVIESIAEPLWLLFQNLKVLKVKVVIEGLQNFLRTIFVLLMVLKYPNLSLLAFSLSMVASSLLYTILYYGYAFLMYRPSPLADAEWRKREFVLSSVWPKPSRGLDRDSLCLIWSFFKHGIAKQFLTEGERYMMTFFNMLDFTDQGTLSVISNVGSLFPRIILAPLEESSYAYFSQNVERGKSLRFQNERIFSRVHQTLSSLLKLVSFAGLVIVVFGQSYSYTFLKIYAGKQLCSSAGPLLLKCFSLYIWLLAVNGHTECFMFASMHNRQVDRHRYCLFYFCFVFLLSSFVLCHFLGSVGFILANCINVVCRIIYSCHFIRSFYQDSGDRFRSPVLGLVPNGSVQGILLVSLLTTSLSNIIFCCDGFFNTCTHLVIGVLLLLATVMTILNQEPELRHKLLRFFRDCPFATFRCNNERPHGISTDGTRVHSFDCA
uniref:Protein RFT1 homolog n=1 Tax=Trichuris muris TaxID=70415 RepID=A0A5S6R5S4_TRIMR